MPRRSFLRLLRLAAPPGDPVPDAELLTRYGRGDSAALELLVRRHADAVWSAGFGVLRNEADADDVFQATFLVLARKAGSVRGACAGGWLHRVAVNAALKLKSRQARSKPFPLHDVEAAAGSGIPADEAGLIHQELARLPDRYRLPVVLCDLEGHTHAQAAKVLGWPVGSVSGRLSRAHAVLRDRLTRRGIAAPAGVLVATAAPVAAVRAASALTSDPSTASATVSHLATGVIAAMRVAKLKLAATVVAGVFGLAGVGTVIATGQGPAPPAAEPAKSEAAPPPAGPKAIVPPAVTKTGDTITAFPDIDSENLDDLKVKCANLLGETEVPVAPADSPLRQLQKARLNASAASVGGLLVMWQKARVELPPVIAAVDQAAVAAADLYPDPKDLRPWVEERVRVLKMFERMAEGRFQAARGTRIDVQVARAARLDAEIALYRLVARPVPAVGR